MKIVKKNVEQKKIELAQKEKRTLDNDAKTIYLERVKKDKKFQEYIVEGIIRKSINILDSLDSIPTKDFKSAEEVGMLVIQAKAAKRVLEKMLNEILN